METTRFRLRTLAACVLLLVFIACAVYIINGDSPVPTPESSPELSTPVIINPPASPSPTPTPTPTPSPTLEPSPEPTPDETANWPADKLFITSSRKAYADGDLRLIIPRIDCDSDVYNGTDDAALKKGACLYDYAQLPGTGNRNVSIAGHRDGLRVTGKLRDGIFYAVDILAEGDFLYLTDAENIYRYKFLDSKIVAADDWGPIYLQGFSCLTLTSCHPIGTSEKRIIIRAELDEIFSIEDDFNFVLSVYELDE